MCEITLTPIAVKDPYTIIMYAHLVHLSSSTFLVHLAHPNPMEVRLIGGANEAEGRVEVLYDGSWGTICNTRWDLRDARVVCRMLGFDGSLEAPGSARFGQGSGSILLTLVGCKGTEDNLAECAHEVIGRYGYSCSHLMDAGAICYSGSMFFSYSLNQQFTKDYLVNAMLIS